MSATRAAVEFRHFAVEGLRVADGAGGPLLRGHAAVFNADSLDLGGFVERVAPGAFSRSLDAARLDPARRPILAFWNHDPGLPLGSTRSGKLRLREDGRGLAFELGAKRLTAQQLDAVKDGDMRMSFGFAVPTGGDSWGKRADGKPLRTLLDVELFEVSLVSQPAYPDTSVALRRLESWRRLGVVPAHPSVVALRQRLAESMGRAPAPRPSAPRPSPSAGKSVAQLRALLRSKMAEDPAAARLARQRAALRCSATTFNDARRIAVHEAGHALAFHLDGSGVGRLGFRFDSDGALSGGFAAQIRPCTSLGLLAGRAAEELAGYSAPADSWAVDRQRAEEVMRDEQRVCTLEDEMDRARRFVAPRMPAVHALADVLVERLEVDGKDATAILARALADSR
jgi:uncharacterized protein